MIHKEELYGASCDNCKEIYSDGHDTGFSYFVDHGILHEKLDSDGWHSGDEGCYCPKCHKIDDEDNLILINQKSN